MKKAGSDVQFPQPSTEEITTVLPKSATIHLRVTKQEKQQIRSTAGKLRLSITEYLLKCHAVVAAKLHDRA